MGGKCRVCEARNSYNETWRRVLKELVLQTDSTLHYTTLILYSDVSTRAVARPSLVVDVVNVKWGIIFSDLIR